MSSQTLEMNELLTELSQKGVRLWTDRDELRIRAPKGALTPDLRQLLAEHKQDLLELLGERGGQAAGLSLPQIEPAPEDRYQPFPLNDIQQAYWVGRTGGLELGNVATHAYIEFDSEGLDPDRLALALNQLIARHDMLRAIVLPTGEQRVLEEVPPYEIEVLDLRGRDPEEIEAAIQAIRDEVSHQVMALDRWPLLEVRATRLEGRRVRIHFSIDLMITDFGSLNLLINEWSRFYQDPDCSLPPLAVTFRDFVLAEDRLEETEPYRRSEKYWLDRLATLPPRPQLPLARSPAAIDQPRFERRHFVLPAARWQRLKERSRKAGLTSSGVLLAAFAEVLAAWSQSPQFCINLTQYNRLPLHPQINDIVGNSISVILLEVDNSRGDTFRERARRVQQQLWQDLDHTAMSGIRVLRELARAQGQNQGARMPVVFTSILGLDSLGKGSASAGLGENVYTVSQTPQVWLDHQVLEDGGALHTSWDAIEDLFPAGLLDDIFESYHRLVEGLADGDGAWNAPVSCPLPVHQAEVRRAVNATDAPLPDALLHTLFAARAETQAAAPAVIAPTRTVTYGELFELGNRLGRWLRRAGAVPNQPVAIVMEKGWEQIAAAVGTLTAGAPYLPVDPALPAERLRALIERGEAKLVLTQSHLDARLEWPAGVERLALDACDLSAFDPGPLAPVATPDDLAYVLFTSGSTGEPKGVMLDHRGPLNTVTFFNQRFGVGPEDRALALSALNFDLSIYDVFGMLAAGGAMVMPDPDRAKDPGHWRQLAAEHRVTVWNSVPTLMKMMVEFLATEPQESVPPGLRLVILSGDWIPVSLPDRIRALWQEVRVIGAGGPTETSIWNIFNPIGAVDPAWASIPYGRPIANNRYHVLDDRLEPRPDWVAGELIAEGVGLARGYWRDAEATAAKFFVHPVSGARLYRTGDLGRYLPDGTLEILGRTDFQVKIDGYRIELGEIESALRQHPEVREAVVAATGEERGNRRLTAYVVPVSAPAAPVAPAVGEEIAAAGEPQEGSEPAPERYTLRSLVSFSRHVSLSPKNLKSLLIDPAKRAAFKLEQRGLRPAEPEATAIELPRRELDPDRTAAYRARHSARRFLDAPVPLERLGRVLDCLEQMRQPGEPLPKYLYPSAGSLYPVQTYLHVKAGRVEGLDAGVYYHDPSAHRLVQLEAGTEIAAGVHVETNRQLFEQCAFSLFLIGKLDAVLPIYGQDLARDFCLLEAGYIGQLLMHSAAEHGLGICPIGALDFDAVRRSFRLDDDHVLVHSLVGGLEATAAEERAAPAAGGRGEPDRSGELRDFLRDKLPEYMVPALFVFLDALPLNANHKVDRKALPDPAAERSRAAAAEMVPPRNEIERTLAQIVCEVLQVESVGIHSNFFELGANSVDVVRIHGRLKESLGLDLPIVDFFRRPTISFLAEHLAGEGEGEDPLERLKKEAERRKLGRRKRRRRSQDILKGKT